MDLVELVSEYKNILLSRERGKRNIMRKQRAWQKIHHALQKGDPRLEWKDWTVTRTNWYKIKNMAKAKQRRFSTGKINDLSELDKKVISMMEALNTEQIYPPEEDGLDLNNVNRSVTEMVTETIEYDLHKPSYSSLFQSKISTDDIYRKVLEQKWKLNEYKLLKIREEILNIQDKEDREEYLNLIYF